MDWDSYYKDLIETEPPIQIQSFNAEFLALVKELLPSGSCTLEAGCGAGWQSRALALSGDFSTTLLDSSDEALKAAKWWFQEGSAAGQFVSGDIRELDVGNYDLVFNVGVLEHYSLADRVAMVKAMARQSSNYVVVLEPNPHNYWYWLWRHFHTSNANWPFGRETPNSSLLEVFQAADLEVDGLRYFASEWTDYLAASMLPAKDRLQEGIREIHSAGLVPAEQRSYLVGAIGRVNEQPRRSVHLPSASTRSFLDDVLAESLVAALGLANSLKADVARLTRKHELEVAKGPGYVTRTDLTNFVSHLDGRLEALASTVSATSAQIQNMRLADLAQAEQQLAGQCKALLESSSSLTASIREITTALDSVKSPQEEATNTLAQLWSQEADAQQEAARWRTRARSLHEALQQAELLRSRAAYGAAEFGRNFDRFRQIEAQRAWKAMLFLRQTYVDLVVHGPSGWFPWLKRAVSLPFSGLYESPEAQVQWPRFEDYLPENLNKPIVAAYQSLDSRLPVEQANRPVDDLLYSSPFTEQQTLDIIVLSIVDFDFRFQRPQQIAVEFAKRGSRVFWISPSKALPMDSPEPYSVRMVQNCWELQLRSPAFDVYHGSLEDRHVEALSNSVLALVQQAAISSCVVYVQIPFWTPLALRLRERLKAPIIYDCMDDWDLFPNIGQLVKAQEPALAKESNLLLVSADKLARKFEARSLQPLTIRNACDFDFYQQVSTDEVLLDVESPVVGFFGGLASWIDAELLFQLALQRPHLTFVFVGQIFDLDVSRLRTLPNVHLEGAQPYKLMPAYLRRFDVCLIPFLANELTDAVDPVKLYEYLALGKPVVATRTAELERCADMVRLASGADEFLAAIDASLDESDAVSRDSRTAFAAANSWHSRVDDIQRALNAHVETVSILIVTYNSADYLAGCLDSVLDNTFYPNFEIVIVDNNSADETLAIAQTYSAAEERITTISSGRNLGFAGGNNLAATSAKGEFYVLLNPDTSVSAGWLGRLLRVLKLERDVDLVSAVTNFAGNEIKINWSYDSYSEMQRFAKRLAVTRFNQRLEIAMAPLMACVLHRDAWRTVGGLDDQYEHGMFEDDDFCMRIRERGRRIVTAEDCFVHHFGQASFSQLEPHAYDDIFRKNQRRFSQRWGDWKPHQMRPQVRPVYEERRLAPRSFFEGQVRGSSPRAGRWTST